MAEMGPVPTDGSGMSDLKSAMGEAVGDHKSVISCGSSPICCARFPEHGTKELGELASNF